MKEMLFGVAEEVFAQFPGYVRGVVLAYQVTNAPSSPDLVEMLRAAENAARSQVSLEQLTEHPRITTWRAAFRAFGAKPSEHRSSIEAMLRRVLRHQELPSINTLVDIGNVVSLRHLVPTGGHALDSVTEDMILRRATGAEDFVPLGEDQVEHPLPGEIIFAEGNTVLTRRWSWRQANHTLLSEVTTSVEFNVDGLPPVSRSEVEEICKQVEALIHQFCGGTVRCEVLTQESPRIKLGLSA